jgi:hypothetical protein
MMRTERLPVLPPLAVVSGATRLIVVCPVAASGTARRLVQPYLDVLDGPAHGIPQTLPL